MMIIRPYRKSDLECVAPLFTESVPSLAARPFFEKLGFQGVRRTTGVPQWNDQETGRHVERVGMIGIIFSIR